MEHQLVSNNSGASKENRIRQLKILIQTLEEQLAAAKRDLRKLEQKN